MNPLTRRRADRRRLADWAARVHRVEQSDADATADGEFGAGEEGPAPVRRLPFELMELAAATAPETAATVVVDPPEMDDPPETVEPPKAAEPPTPAEPEKTAQPPEPAAVVEATALLHAARKALEGRDLHLAGQLYGEVLQENPQDLRARNGLALVLDASGEHVAALEQLDRCRAQDEGNLEILVNRCGVLGTLGRYADAERGLRTALEREPSNAAAHFQLGLVASRRGRWQDAVPYFRRAAELDPTLAGAHFYLGEALNHMDDLPGALQAYQRAVELSPHNPKAWYGMGIVLDRMNRPDDAAQQYRRSRELQGQ